MKFVFLIERSITTLYKHSQDKISISANLGCISFRRMCITFGNLKELKTGSAIKENCDLMKEIIFVSDIHGNYDALQALLDLINNRTVYCLGDLVGYGANPNEVVDWARTNKIESVMGNHEYAVATGDISWFNPQAQKAILWTRSILTRENFQFISNLPKKIEMEFTGKKALLVHGSPIDPIFEYVLPETHQHMFDYYLSRNRVEMIAMGHTHIPFVSKLDAGMIFNPGSTGQPRSGDPRASCAFLKINDARIEHKLVEYDIDEAAQKILKAGLPSFFAQRLYQGI